MRLYELIKNIITSVRPIKYGGTGKTTASEALLALGGVSITKLWENASPTSSFGTQTISLDLSNYDFVIMHFAAPILTVILKVGATADNIAAPVFSSIRFRNVRVTQTGIIFGEGSYKASFTGSATTDNSLVRPLEIYGIKGIIGLGGGTA